MVLLNSNKLFFYHCCNLKFVFVVITVRASYFGMSTPAKILRIEWITRVLPDGVTWLAPYSNNFD